MYGHIRCIYTVLANPNNIWLGGTGVCCTHAAISWHSLGTVLVAQVFLLHSPGTVCFLAQSWHCLGGTGVCCTVLAQCVSWHSPGTVLVAQVFVAHTLQFPVATSNGFACTLLPVFFDDKHHSHVHNICLGGTGVCCTHAAISCCNQQWVCMHTFTCIL